MDCFGEDVSADGLTRRVWEFSVIGQYLTLRRYAEQTRTTTRHKWRGPCWDSADERSYHSALSRPASIPPEIIKQAASRLTLHVTIGWTRPQSTTGYVSLQAKAYKPRKEAAS